jgi:hypothetical protein
VVARARLKLHRAHVRILGVLINDLRIGGRTFGGYGAYAKYEYGYGYGYGDGTEAATAPGGAPPAEKPVAAGASSRKA